MKSQTPHYTRTKEDGDVLLDEKNKENPATTSKWPKAHHVEIRVYLSRVPY